MKFMIDAQLPPSLVAIFKTNQQLCIHTTDLPNKNLTSDQEITRLSVNEKWIVVTKGADFFHSFLLKKEPYKLILVTTGNIRLKQMQSLFQSNISTIINLIEKHEMIEVHSGGISVLF